MQCCVQQAHPGTGEKHNRKPDQAAEYVRTMCR